MKYSIHASFAAAVVGLLQTFASGLPAQTSKECTTAAKIVASGSVNASQKSAYITVTGCGSVGANAFVTGIPKNATVTDTTRLEDYMGQVDNWRDASIYNAVLQLANNSSATAQSRVYAIRHLIVLLQPNFRYTYGGLVAAADTTTGPDGSLTFAGGCQGSISAEGRGSVIGAALPAGFEAQIRSTLSALAASHSAPKQVRAAASCLLPP